GILRTCAKANQTLSGFLSGKLLDSLIIGIICFACMRIMNLEFVALISIIIGVTNIIPFFGPFFGAVPSALLLLMTNPKHVIPFVVFIIILQQFDGNILGPKILGDSTGLSPFWVMFAIFVGGGLFGVIGMLLGVPVFAVIYAFTKRFVNRRLKSKSLPSDTALYRDAYEIRDGEFITKEHLFTEIKNPKGSSQHKNAAEEGEKYHLFRTLFSRHAAGSSESTKTKDDLSEKDTLQKTEESQSKEESDRNT
ncbi:MAG: AI-2E family transporter, partial [Lachnospiraceae bacterium]|nr:AI-2E family transporter [Lachnospiraceae bacterium]